jgi:pyruvate/2-oxoglutarate dehydrogenase complex dihydrolipoamide acyltransferase (E2) component
MEPAKLSSVRKALLWWFDWPGNPYVCVNCAIDFSAARAYLDDVNARARAEGERAATTTTPEPVTVQHLLAASIARVLSEFPDANARIIGHRIFRQEDVGIAMPVSLRNFSSGNAHDLSMALIDRADKMPLRELAASCSGTIREERAGRSQNWIVREITRVAKAAPYPVLALGLNVLDKLVKRPFVAAQVYRHFTVTTVLTNPGAAFGKLDGALFRSASMSLPQRLFHVGTVWGVSAVQDEVIAVDGEPRVRPVLPVVLAFDHRLFDGIQAGEICVRFAAILKNPSAVFGPDALAPMGRA